MHRAAREGGGAMELPKLTVEVTGLAKVKNAIRRMKAWRWKHPGSRRR